MNYNGELRIVCPACTYINHITNLMTIGYCEICCNQIYSPDNETLTQITEANKKRNKIEENFKKAYECIPSSFIPSKMIYLDAKITVDNGLSQDVRFLIDTGAQVSVLPINVAKALQIDDIIDEKYSGELKGVGNDMIMGKIHYLEVVLPFGMIPCSFIICKNPNLEPILGIDMMQQMGLKLDFSNRTINFSTYQNEEFKIDM